MRRHRSGALVAACAVVLAGSPAGGAAPPSGPAELVVTGSGPAAGTFILGVETSFDVYDARITIGLGGRYGGVLFRSASTGREVAGVYRVAALEAYGRPDLSPILPLLGYTMALPRVTLRPGTYRAHLLGDGPVEVRLPLQQGRSLTVSPTGRSTQRLHVEEHLVPTDLDPDVDHFVLRHKFRRPVAAWSGVIGQFGGPGTATQVGVRVCFSRRPTCRGGVFVGTAPRVTATGNLSAATMMLVDRRLPRDGDWYAVVDVTTETAVTPTVWLSYLQVDY